MPLNILVAGAGICGPAFATLLQGSDPRHQITIVERSPSLRKTGQQIDLKGHGTEIMRKMSLLESVKSHRVAESGMELVDGSGKSLIQLMVNDSNKGAIARSVTSEYEIMRGDLVNVVYEASLIQRANGTRDTKKEGALTYEFGKTIAELTQIDCGVNVTFSDGQKRHYDLVVGADGQGSRTRRLAFGQTVSDEAFKSLGTHAAFYSIPKISGEGEIAKSYIASGRRAIMTRTGDRPVTQVFLFSMSNSERLRTQMREPVEKQKEAWAETFQGAGWQTPRFLTGLKACDDFYSCELAQVKLKNLYTGRVALIGDAGYCPSVFTGQGTTASLVGAYILAGELARHGNEVDVALKAYDKAMEAPILEYQRMPSGASPGSFFPSSRLATWILHNTIWAISTFKIDKMIQRILPNSNTTDVDSWILPEYPELKLRP